MKKQLIILALLYAASASAQIEKGSFLLGTDLMYTSTKTKEDFPSTNGSISEFRFAPSAGYFAVQGFVLGVQADYTETTDNSNGISYYSSPHEQNANVLGIGPFFRYYTFFGDKFCLQNALSLYALSGEANYQYISYSPSNIAYTTYSTEKLRGGKGAYNLKVGYLIKESIGLQVSLINLSYTTYTNSNNSGISTSLETTTNEFEFTSMMSAPQIGIEFYLRPKTAKK